MLNIFQRYSIYLLMLSCLCAFGKGNDGTIFLKDGKSYQGLVHFEPGDRVVSIEIGNRTLSYSPYQVYYFNYYDPKMDTRRVFAPVDYSLHPNATSREFFEVLLTGSVSLLRMEEKDRINYIHPLAPEIPMSRIITEYHHYLFIDGVLHEYENFKKQALPLLSEFGDDLCEFIHENHLKLNDFISQIRILDFYNQLADENYVAIRE